MYTLVRVNTEINNSYKQIEKIKNEINEKEQLISKIENNIKCLKTEKNIILRNKLSFPYNALVTVNGYPGEGTIVDIDCFGVIVNFGDKSKRVLKEHVKVISYCQL